MADDRGVVGAPSRGHMSNTKITINGQQYDSPEAMPPDVRRMYEEAMRVAGASLASGKSGSSTQVFTGRTGDLGASLVVNRVITVNDRTYGSIDELPPDVRQLYEQTLKGAAPGSAHPTTGLHVSVNMGRPHVQGPAQINAVVFDDSGRHPAPAPLPIEPSTLESKIRSLPMSLAILILIGL